MAPRLVLPVALAASLAFAAVAGGTAQVDEHGRRRPAGHADQGLPVPGARWLPYDDAPDHPANRFFRLAFLVEVTPHDVGWALPREQEDGALPEDWMLRWRDGAEGDARLFGGDGRQLPREGFDGEEEAALRAALEGLEGDVAASLRAQPALAVLLQHDVLRLAMRLRATGRNPGLVPALVAAARRLALPEETLRDTRYSLHEDGEDVPAAAEALATCAELRAEDVEVERRSTRLFDASRTLLWSRVWLQAPKGAEATRDLMRRASAGEDVEVPIGTRGVLVQGVVALASNGAAVATNVEVEVRAQWLRGRGERSREDPTTSRDGVDFDIVQLEREGVRRGTGPRVIDDDDQDLFRDYGTLKHTTYRAQCSLCHRTTRTPEPHVGGFPVLRAHAKPRPAGPRARYELAEEQVAAWLSSLEEGAR